jgi:3-hydroxyacyl-[acyl-carrier-protein] dehydratase
MIDLDAILPHRPPMRLVDRITELEAGVRAVGLRKFLADEPWFSGHFPGNPVLPGVITAECMAQVAAVVHLSAEPLAPGEAPMLVGVDRLRLRRPIRPGDTAEIRVMVTERRARMWRFVAELRVDGQRAADAHLLAAVVA